MTTGERLKCTSYPASRKSAAAPIRSATGEVRTSSSRASSGGISENRMRVRPRGSRASRPGLTNLVANDALAVGHCRKACTRSAVLSQISASTEQSPFSPMSYTHASGSHWFGSGLRPCRATWRARWAMIRSVLVKTVMGLAYPLRRGT